MKNEKNLFCGKLSRGNIFKRDSKLTNDAGTIGTLVLSSKYNLINSGYKGDEMCD